MRVNSASQRGTDRDDDQRAVPELAVYSDRDGLIADLAEHAARRAPVHVGDTLGLRELRHDVDKELAVLQLLLDRLEVPADQHEPLTAVARQVDVISDVLAAAADPQPSTDVDVAELARDVCAVLETVHDGRMVMETSGHPVVHGERGLLRRAMVNLLDNARRAAPRGVIRVQVHALRRATAFEVEDDGSGQQPPVSGRGLGLPIVRYVAARHGGTATVGRSPLGGRRVLLVLPAGPPR